MPNNKPNIVFILSDDQGPWAMGCAGNGEIITPNLDALAAQGMRMENFYCASPVCSPARASLLTGRIPSQHGVHDWLRTDTREQEETEYLRGTSAYTDVLAQNGYVCGLSGKWHMGNSAVPQKGFSHWYCHQAGGGPYYGAPMYRDGVLQREEGYITDAITDDALEFLQEVAAGEAPFYLHVTYTAPHSPWLHNHPQEYLDLYKDCPFASLPSLPRHPDAIYLTEEAHKDLRGNQMGYFAAVTAMDAGIGRILQKLADLGLDGDTLVVFSSDNGFSCGHHGYWGKGNGTFPINLYEESVKVPFIARWPGRIPAGSVCDMPLSAYDFRPTLLALAGLEDGEAEALPGSSFAPVLLGRQAAGEEPVVVFDEYGPNRMIRRGHHKYVRRYPYGPDQLYDLQADPGETNNLLAQDENSPLACGLRAELEAWFVRYANPALDGARQPVYGSGQIGPVGGTAPAHSCDDYIKQSPGYKRIRNIE